MCVVLGRPFKKNVHNSPRSSPSHLGLPWSEWMENEFDYVDVYVFYCFPPDGRMDLPRCHGKGSCLHLFADSHERQNVG